MKVLAIDPANKSGWAHTCGRSGVWLLTDRMDEHPGARLVRFEKRLLATLDELGADLIAAEDASFGSPNPAVQAMHNEMRGVIHLIGARLSIDVKLFAPCTIKAFATGNGHAKKPQMIAACQRILGVVPADDNEADAIWIRELALRPDCWAVTKPKKVGRFKAKAKKAERLF